MRCQVMDEPVEKAYAYVTRFVEEPCDLLVFSHRNRDAGVQVPKGTVEPGEEPREAVVREIREESGLTELHRIEYLVTDTWEHPSRGRYRRHFFHVEVDHERERWSHSVSGGGEDDGLVFEYRWQGLADVSLSRGMDEYLDQLFD